MYLHILLIGITVYYPVDSNAFCLVAITVGGKPSIRVTHKEVLVAPTSLISFLKGLGHAILGNFSTDRMVIELTKISK